MGFFVETAYAADVVDSAQAGQNSPVMLVIMAAFLVAVYFIIIRPQNKKAKEQQQMVSKLAKGDEIVTAGGVVGKIQKINGNYLVVEVSDGVEITFQRDSIAKILPKGMIKEIG